MFHRRCLAGSYIPLSPRGVLKKVVLKNFDKFTGKHLCRNLFFNKVAELRPATLVKKRLPHRCFPVNFAKFLRTSYFYRTLAVATFIENPEHRVKIRG